MSKGYRKQQERYDALHALGRPLARRAHSRCELCEEAGVSLQAVEIEPLSQEPELERTLMLCQPCAHGVQGKPLEPQRWRFLESAIWTELAPAQVAAVRIVRRLDAQKIAWATALLDTLYLEPEVQTWLDS